MMKITDNNVAMDAFVELCDELESSEIACAEEAQYWVFERGYRSAVQEFIEIMETGVQRKKFTSPKLQAIAEKLMA
jgi:hypothetical protein